MNTLPTNRETVLESADGSLLLAFDQISGVTPDGRIVTHPLDRRGAEPARIINQQAPACLQPQIPQPLPVVPGAGAGAGQEEQGLPLAVRQAVMLGCAISVSTGVTLWLAGMGLAAAQPALHEAIEFMKLAIAFVALVVGSATAAVVYVRRRVRRVNSSAGGTGATYAVFHRTTHNSIGKQSARGRATVTNNF
ncbi:hypothetical protein OG871_39880 (plasmid) [Kitasatospora sp. NBC_00374]|uniref:hypothetical protein n=1 Tax=Kitasatospora sp. NBC_00374 TaxID=2975964 RepID=UPI002F90CC97